MVSVVWDKGFVGEQGLPKLMLFIEETLIKFPPVPNESRQAKVDFTDYFEVHENNEMYYAKLDIKAGEQVTFPIYYLNPHEYNDNPYFSKQFKDMPLEKRVQHTNTFFNPSGVHQCPGQYFARYVVSKFLIFLLISGYEVKLDPEVEEFDLEFSGTTEIKNKYDIVFVKVGDTPESLVPSMKDMVLGEEGIDKGTTATEIPTMLRKRLVGTSPLEALVQ